LLEIQEHTIDGVLDLPEFEVIQPTPIDCNNETTTISISSMQVLAGYTATHDGFTLSFGNGDLVTDQPGEWTVQATATNGCTNTIDFIIELDTISPEPILEIQNIDCLNTDGLLTITNPEQNATYIWEDVLNAGSPVEGISYAPTTDQAINLTSIGGNGCESEISAEIQIDTIAPSLNLSADQLTCTNTTSNLMVNTPVDSIEYDWYLNDEFIEQNTIIQSDIPGSYEVIAFNSTNHCTSEETIELLEVETPRSFDFNLVPPPCGEEEYLINSFSVEGGNGPYSYNTDIEDPFWLETSVESTLYEGENLIQIQDANGCILDTTLVLTLTGPFEIETNEKLTVDWGTDTTLNLVISKPIDEIESIAWTPSDGLSCADCTNPSVTLYEDQFYEIQVIDKNGCEETAEIRIEVLLNLMVYVPNIFTPDELNNNLFFPFATQEHVKMVNDFYIFDRWGNRVFNNTNFSPNDPSAGWDGTILGGDATPGVYGYIMEVVFYDESTKIIAGDVTLAR